MIETSAALAPKERRVLSIILLAIAAMVMIDVISDARDGAAIGHMSTEIVAGVIAIAGFGLLIGKNFRAKRHLRGTHEQLAKSREEAAYWKASSKTFVDGLNRAIDEQFQKWNFSPSEKEVALLFLKGLSSKEVAEIRGVADRTIRAQATTIYEKSGLSGRAELSAFFLEDLLAPQERTT